ncbi:hypothetical protein [Methylobacterium trifolii]|uniref:Uncharacterized protein n=1 Tax=Methylobacterium trifolii TaxID=1003092 RepID=A0ABQ4TSP7_9HYPH|nr:hypothetical protein [Methylobacterium trifolii]GJE58061.1 hypothetical protein MPOCJGCO_0139 [Methylobacterium trifolii]
MPIHFCIDPHDQYAQAEVSVEFEQTADAIRLISARDASQDDILPDLEDVQRRALESEIIDDYRQEVPSRDGRLQQGPILDRKRVGRA